MLLDVVGCCWMLDVVDCCWLLLDVVGCCWMLDVLGCCWVLLGDAKQCWMVLDVVLILNVLLDGGEACYYNGHNRSGGSKQGSTKAVRSGTTAAGAGEITVLQ